MKQLSYTAAEIDERLGRVDNFSNPNLLINPFFQVNQRGQTSVTLPSSLSYCFIDGFKFLGTVTESTCEIVSAGLKFTVVDNATAGTMQMRQEVENPGAYSSKIITASTKFAENTTGYSRMYLRYRVGSTYSEFSTADIGANGIMSITQTLPADINILEVFLYALDTRTSGTAGDYCIVESLMLEESEISTIASRPMPRKSRTIDDCKYLFRLWKTEAARTAALNEVGLMRLENPTLGTISIGGTTYYTASAEL